MSLYAHDPHPQIALRQQQGPVKVDDQRPRHNLLARFNTRVGLGVTVVVGTMWCAYLFTLVAVVSLPDALNSGQSIIIVAWIAQTFLQLVLLPIIIVGQNIQAKAADGRAEQTYKDAEAVLQEAEQIQAHLSIQDEALERLAEKLGVELDKAHA